MNSFPASSNRQRKRRTNRKYATGWTWLLPTSQREKTAWDKIEEVRYLREVLEKAKTKPRFVELLRRIVEKTFEDGELQTGRDPRFYRKGASYQYNADRTI